MFPFSPFTEFHSDDNCILFISGFASILVIALNVDIPPVTRREYIQGSFEISTPFRGMRTTSGSLDHSTTKTGFKSLVKYTCPKGTRYSVDASYIYTGKVKQHLANDSLVA
jgi:hypothetical protein